MVGKSLQILKELRAQGKTRTAIYESDEEEIEDTTSLKHQLDDEDFVEDDDGEGYIDDGTNEVAAETPKPKRVKTANTIMNAFKRAPKPLATPVRKSDVSCDDLFAQLGSMKKTTVKATSAQLTPMTPTPMRKPILGARPVMRSFEEIKPVKAPEPVQDIEVTSNNVDAQSDDDDDIDLSAIPEHSEAADEEPVLPSDPPMPETPMRKHTENEQTAAISSYPTPNQSSEPDFEFTSYDQNVVEFSSEIGAQEESAKTGEDLDFFFTDFHEIGDKLMLFGRTQSTTTCVVVERLYRNVFFLPPDGMSAKDIQREVSVKIGSLTGEAVKSRPCTKKYCFGDKNIPTEAEYLQVQLPYSVGSELLYSRIDKSLAQKIFGAETTLYESFMLERKIKGPNWLKAKSVKQLPSSTTGCGITASVDFKDISAISEPSAMPSLTIMSLSIRTWLNPDTKVQEIAAITARFFKNVAYDTRTPASQLPSAVITGIRPINGVFPMRFTTLLKEDQERAKFKSIFEHRNEVSLLKWFLPYLKKHDPDMIVGHNLENIHLGVLFERLRALNVSTWHLLGRLGNSSSRMPQRVDKNSLKYWVPGRLCCDLNNDMGQSATPKCTTWSLSEMAKIYVNETRPEVDFDISKSIWDYKDAKGLIMILRQNERDTLTTTALTIAIQIIPLSKVLTNLAGNSWFKTLSGSRVDRNNNLLLHEFTAANYIVPQKRFSHGGDGSRGKAKFTGGLVLDPQKGLWRDMVLVMDFNSLYPSIIREFNICFSTVDLRPRDGAADDSNALPDLPDQSVEQGVFPRIIQNLVERRQEAKSAMKSPSKSEAEVQQLDIRQQALKLTANSMYGCLGFEASRFYAMPLAELVTSKGREILQATRQLAEATNDLSVLYGDTDSLMINTRTSDYEKALSLGNDFKRQVNSRYRKLEIDIDYVFSALLLNAKKKYAATKVSRGKDNKLVSELEVKGIDLKRREFCDLSKDMSKHALHLILESADLDEAINEFYDYLKSMAAKIREGEIPLNKYLIRTKLGKDPLKYSEAEAKKLPHVILALRRLKAGEIVKADDFMQYVVVAGEEPASERARTIAEAKSQNLTIDYEFYLNNQILGPLKRICANIEGFDDGAICDSLGVEKTVQHHFNSSSSGTSADPAQEYAKFETTMSATERFKDCKPLAFKCTCGHEFYYRGLDNLSGRGIECTECKNPLSNFLLLSQLERRITAEIQQYYAGWNICGECKYETRQIGVIGRNCMAQNGRCPGRVQPVYTSRELYAQLSYYSSLFDLPDDSDSKYKAVMLQNEERFAMLKRLAARYLDNNARRVVDMKSLFALF